MVARSVRRVVRRARDTLQNVIQNVVRVVNTMLRRPLTYRTVDWPTMDRAIIPLGVPFDASGSFASIPGFHYAANYRYHTSAFSGDAAAAA